MNIERLQDYYNRIDRCAVIIDQEVDFDYIQKAITKIAIYTEDLNRILGEILVEKTRLEHTLTDRTFEYELRFTKYMNENPDVKKFNTGKERKDYINYFLLKDNYKEIKNLEQELKDIESLLELAKKKAKDLDRTYPKLKILWDSVQTEMKYIKKMGSDSDYINEVKNKIDNEKNQSIPIFSDTLVEQIQDDLYNNKETIENIEDSAIDDILNEL
jgi:hypothetical protein